MRSLFGALFASWLLASPIASHASEFFPVRDIGGVLVTHTADQAKYIIDGGFKNVVWAPPVVDSLHNIVVHTGSNAENPKGGPVINVTIKADERGAIWMFEREVILSQQPLPSLLALLDEARKKYGRTYQYQPKYQLLYTEDMNGMPPRGSTHGCAGMTATTLQSTCNWLLNVRVSTSQYDGSVRLHGLLLAPRTYTWAIERSKQARDRKAADDAAAKKAAINKAVSGAKL